MFPVAAVISFLLCSIAAARDRGGRKLARGYGLAAVDCNSASRCTARSAASSLECNQRDTLAAVALGFEQVDGLRDRGLRLWFTGRGHRRTTGPHDRVPRLAFQPISLAHFASAALRIRTDSL